MAGTTLLEAIEFFSDEGRARDFVAQQRWPDGKVTCPTCGRDDVTFQPSRNVWQCKSRHAKRAFSVKVGTIFEDSPIPLSKWLPATWLLASAKNGISSYELARAVGVTQKSAWFMLHRIRLAMQDDGFSPMGGTVEVDETYVGGRAEFMHKARRQTKIQSTGPKGKTAVFGLLERHGPDGHSRARAMAETQVLTRNNIDTAEDGRRVTLTLDLPVGINYHFVMDGEISDTSTYDTNDSANDLVSRLLQKELRQEFLELARVWHDETGHLSSPVQIAMHDAYQQIIALGPPAIPLILQDLEDRGGQWFWALRALNKGVSPVPPSAAGSIRQVKDAWLTWGRNTGYIH